MSSSHPHNSHEFETHGGLSREAAAHLLPSLVDIKNSSSVIVCANEEEAARWFHNLEFFASLEPKQTQYPSILFLPAWEQSPYRNLQPSSSVRKQRLSTISALHSSFPWVVVTSIHAALQTSIDIETIARSLQIKRGSVVPPEQLKVRLLDLGYTLADPVEDVGNFSWRGGIVDLFIPTFDFPVRIEFFDDTVEDIKFFNPESQRSLHGFAPEEAINIIPAREFLCDQNTLALAREKIKDWCDTVDIPRNARDRIGSLLGQGIVAPEMDYFVAYFQSSPASFSSLIPKNTNLIFSERSEALASAAAWLEKEREQELSARERQTPFPELTKTFHNPETVFSSPNWGKKLDLTRLAFAGNDVLSEDPWPRTASTPKDPGPLMEKIRCAQKKWPRLGIVANTESQLNRIEFLLSQ